MMPKTLHPDDRENLSALFDGALQGDAARFAYKRLEHDAQWQQSLSRWQLIGDALRGQATASAAPGFADRVAAAIAAEAAERAAKPKPLPTQRWRWISGTALAASVAMAALFMTRPFSDDPAVAEAPTVAASPHQNETVQPQPSVEAVAPTVPERAVVAAAAAPMSTQTPRRSFDRRASRGQSQRVALRTSRRQSESLEAVNGGRASGSTNVESTAQASPFDPQHAEIASRPWPRAVLPNYRTSGGLTAGYGNNAGSPTFYPFEPQPPASEQPANGRDSGPQPNGP